MGNSRLRTSSGYRPSPLLHVVPRNSSIFALSFSLPISLPVVEFFLHFSSLNMEDSKIIMFSGKHGEDFQLWLARTEAALEANGVLDVVTNNMLKEGTDKVSRSDLMTNSISTARFIIIQDLVDRLLRLCLSVKHNPFKMWTRLKGRTSVSSTAMQVQLQFRYRFKQSHTQYKDF